MQNPPDSTAKQLVDEELDQVEQYLRALNDFGYRAGRAIRRAFDEVIDGPRTGRWSLEELDKTEKTYIGTKVEILLRAEFELPDGEYLDCNIAGAEVDIKFTIANQWMIPTEAVEFICLLVKANDNTSVFSVGLIRAIDEHLARGKNKDGKRGINPAGRQATRWIVKDGRLPENLILHLPEEVRDRIFSHRNSGQERVTELFRLVQNRVIPRQVVEVVARQKDPMRRARQAKAKLLKEGIFVGCGTYSEQRRDVERLGIGPLAKDEWISTTVPAGWEPTPRTS